MLLTLRWTDILIMKSTHTLVFFVQVYFYKISIDFRFTLNYTQTHPPQFYGIMPASHLFFSLCFEWLSGLNFITAASAFCLDKSRINTKNARNQKTAEGCIKIVPCSTCIFTKLLNEVAILSWIISDYRGRKNSW